MLLVVFSKDGILFRILPENETTMPCVRFPAYCLRNCDLGILCTGNDFEHDKFDTHFFLSAILPLKKSTVFVKLESSKEGLNRLKNIFLDFCSSFEYIK